MTTDPRHVASDYLAAMTDAEAAEFITEARRPIPPQLSRADLAGMTPAAINAAREAGQCADLLGVPREQTELITRATRLQPVSRADLAALNRAGRHDLTAAYAPHADRITD